MERVLFQEIATPADLHEHHKWARRVGAFYGILFLGVSALWLSTITINLRTT